MSGAGVGLRADRHVGSDVFGFQWPSEWAICPQNALTTGQTPGPLTQWVAPMTAVGLRWPRLDMGQF